MIKLRVSFDLILFFIALIISTPVMSCRHSAFAVFEIDLLLKVNYNRIVNVKDAIILNDAIFRY